MLVFVYGTLTDPDRVETVLGGPRSASEGSRETPPAGTDETTSAEATAHEFVGRATIDGLHRVDGEYPTLAPGGSVEGRLLEVTDDGLSAIDAYEGVDRGLYVRVGVPVADGETTVTADAMADGEAIMDGEVTADGEATMDIDATAEVDAEADPGGIAWTYVGDPIRLGVEDRVDWPGGGPFETRVSNYVSDETIVVRTRE